MAEEATTKGWEREIEIALKNVDDFLARLAITNGVNYLISALEDSEKSNAELRERLEVYWKRLDVEAHDRIRLCMKIAELERVITGKGGANLNE